MIFLDDDVSDKLGVVAQELSKAKETIAVLEKELSSERSRLRSMVAEQERMQHEKKRIMADMQRNESVGSVSKQILNYGFTFCRI